MRSWKKKKVGFRPYHVVNYENISVFAHNYERLLHGKRNNIETQLTQKFHSRSLVSFRFWSNPLHRVLLPVWLCWEPSFHYLMVDMVQFFPISFWIPLCSFIAFSESNLFTFTVPIKFPVEDHFSAQSEKS